MNIRGQEGFPRRAVPRLYSVVTDFARFLGKSTSTPFMIAKSARCQLELLAGNVSRSRGKQSAGRKLTVRQKLEGDDIDEPLQAVDGPGDANDFCGIRHRLVVLVANDDYRRQSCHLSKIVPNVLGRPFRAVTCARAD